MEKESKMLQEVLDHLKNATPEQLEKDWEKVKEWESIGPRYNPEAHTFDIETVTDNSALF